VVATPFALLHHGLIQTSCQFSPDREEFFYRFVLYNLFRRRALVPSETVRSEMDTFYPVLGIHPSNKYPIGEHLCRNPCRFLFYSWQRQSQGSHCLEENRHFANLYLLKPKRLVRLIFPRILPMMWSNMESCEWN
jgi:hypothetical protein